MSDPTPDLLDDLAQALRTTDHLGHTAWLDTVEARVVMLTFDPHEAPLDDEERAPVWVQQQRDLARRVVEQPDRYVRIVPTGTPGRLQRFLGSIEDQDLQHRLRKAARGGRGAYRRVREALRARGLEALWHAFELEADRDLARAWLRGHQR